MIVRHLPYRGIATLALLFTPIVILGVETPDASNLERLSLASRAIADSIYSASGLPDTLCLKMIAHPGDWIVEQGFMSSAESLGRVTIRCTPPYRGEVLIAITDIRVVYVDFGDEDVFRRDVTVDLALSLPRIQGDKELRSTKQVASTIADTISRSGAEDLATREYAFTLPRYNEQRSTSFWKKIAEPVLVLGTTVTMVVLLFTTRS